jgi:hypothetical protein
MSLSYCVLEERQEERKEVEIQGKWGDGSGRG